jgi:hypothetical protein
MNHDEATQQMIAEKYLLDELSPEVREQFEEHFFSCAACANDLQAGVAFIEQSKAILSRLPADGEPQHSVRRQEKAGWLDWLFRPAIAAPVIALLVGTIAYLAIAPRVKPQLLSAVFVNVGSRGGNTPSITVPNEQGFLLRVSVPPDGDYSSRAINIFRPDGKLEGSLKLPASLEEDTYFVQIPPGHHPEGTYTVAVAGTTNTGAASEIARNTFELHVRQ